jgi:hypothetical protein
VLARVVALLALVTVMPTVELAEQAMHAIDHLAEADVPDHDAHHEPGGAEDEHGCTGLIHLCSCHRTLSTGPVAVAAPVGIETLDTLAGAGPPSLHDVTSLEPPHRPPIG